MVDAVWATARLSYAGWVPNVGSHLSFSLIGSRAGKGVVRLSARVAYEDRIARVVCALQTRTTDDMLLPPSLARRSKPDLQQHWMLVGETVAIDVPTGTESAKPKSRIFSPRLLTAKQGHAPAIDKITTARDEQGALVGRVLIIPYEEDPVARAEQQAMLSRVKVSLSKAAFDRDGQTAIQDAETTVRESELGLVTVNFALMRTGEARLWFESEHPQFNDEEHRQIARQAYFFLKDMSHRHVHHDQLDDQITPLIRFKNETAEQRLKSEVEWRRETLWSLSRVADKLMASEKLNSLREALGMLAYADAFQKTLLPHVRNPDNPLTYLPNKSAYGYDFQHIRESTRVRIDQTAARRTVTGQLIAAVFAGAIASLSLVSSLISSHNARIAVGDATEKFEIKIWPWLLKAAGGYPIFVMAISAYLLYAAFALMLSDILFTRPRRRFQLLRGITLSIAKRFKLDADQSLALLVLIYVILIGVFIGLTIALISIISVLPPDLGLNSLRSILDELVAKIPTC